MLIDMESRNVESNEAKSKYLNIDIKIKKTMILRAILAYPVHTMRKNNSKCVKVQRIVIRL